jgi:hypothetical protein
MGNRRKRGKEEKNIKKRGDNICRIQSFRRLVGTRPSHIALFYSYRRKEEKKNVGIGRRGQTWERDKLEGRRGSEEGEKIIKKNSAQEGTKKNMGGGRVSCGLLWACCRRKEGKNTVNLSLVSIKYKNLVLTYILFLENKYLIIGSKCFHKRF